MGKPTLLPCPFCGAPAVEFGHETFMGPVIGCSNGCCPAKATARGSAVGWNTRAPNPLAATLAARDERVRELEGGMTMIRGALVMGTGDATEIVSEIDRLCGLLLDKDNELEQKAERIRELEAEAEVGRRWAEDSSLERWFPLSVARIVTLEADNATLRGTLIETAKMQHEQMVAREERTKEWEAELAAMRPKAEAQS